MLFRSARNAGEPEALVAEHVRQAKGDTGFDATTRELTDLVKASSLPSQQEHELVAGCELLLEALVARRKISRSEGGSYGRSVRRQGGLPPEYPDREE